MTSGTQHEARRGLSSAPGLGRGGIVYFSNALAFTIGALIAWGWAQAKPQNQERFNIPIAAGLVAGGSLINGAARHTRDGD